MTVAFSLPTEVIVGALKDENGECVHRDPQKTESRLGRVRGSVRVDP